MKKLNCAQKTLLGLRDLTGLSEEESENIASAFGGGACCGEMCGAISGALMALGTIYNDSSQPVRPVAAEFQKRFLEKNGYLRCSDLLGFDMSNPDECKKCDESGMKGKVCPDLIKGAEDLVRELAEEYRK